MSQEQTGVVKVVFADRGFGFIRPDAGGDDVWFHVQGHGNAEAEDLSAGDAVIYEPTLGRDGRPQGLYIRAAVAGAAARGAASAAHVRGDAPRGGSGYTARGGGGSWSDSGERAARGGGGGTGFAASKALNEQIQGCASAQELQGIVQERVDDFNTVNVATAMRALERLTKGPGRRTQWIPQIVSALARRGQETAVDFNPPSVANALSALASMGVEDQSGLVSALARRGQETAGAFDPKAVASTLWALAKMGVEDQGGLVSALARRGQETAGAFNPQAVANTLWALATMGVEDQGGLVSALARRGQETAGAFNPQAVANTLWALLRLRVSVAPELLGSFSELARSSGDPVLLATVFRAFKRSHVAPDAPLVAALKAAGDSRASARTEGAQVGANALFSSWEEVTRFLQSEGKDDKDGPAAAETASVAASQVSKATTTAAGQGAGEGLARDVVGDGGRVLAHVPAGCSVRLPEGKDPRGLTGAVVPCSAAMGQAAAGFSNFMRDGERGSFVMVGQVRTAPAPPQPRAVRAALPHPPSPLACCAGGAVWPVRRVVCAARHAAAPLLAGRPGRPPRRRPAAAARRVPMGQVRGLVARGGGGGAGGAGGECGGRGG